MNAVNPQSKRPDSLTVQWIDNEDKTSVYFHSVRFLQWKVKINIKIKCQDSIIPKWE